MDFIRRRCLEEAVCIHCYSVKAIAGLAILIIILDPKSFDTIYLPVV